MERTVTFCVVGAAGSGLSAAGVMCSGWVNGTYCFFGGEMSFTIWSGRSAGMEVSEYLKNKK